MARVTLVDAAAQLERPDRLGDSERGRERHRHRRDEDDEREGGGLREARPDDRRVGEHHDDQRHVDDDQVPHDPEDHGLEVGRRLGLAHQQRGPAEAARRAGRDDSSGRLTPGDDGGAERLVARTDVHRHRLAGQRRLVEAHMAFEHVDVGADHVTDADADHVAGDELAGGHELPRAVAEDPGVDGQAATEELERVVGAGLLQEADHRVHDEQRGDDAGLEALAEQEGEDDRPLEHPGQGPPEPSGQLTPDRSASLGDLVGSHLVEEAGGLVAGEAGQLTPTRRRRLGRGQHPLVHGLERLRVRRCGPPVYWTGPRSTGPMERTSHEDR